MADVLEVAVTSDASAQLWTACVWNPRACTMLMTYKGGASMSRSLSLIGNDYLISGDRVKPLLHVWALNKNEQLQIRMVCPGRVNSLSVSPNGMYCVCGIEEKLHVWHVSSGRLLAVTGRHYQPISCIRFTDDGSCIVTAGEDGVILVWVLAYLISMSEEFLPSVSIQNEPLYMFSDHSAPVTDICIGHGRARGRLASVSADHTCKLYDLTSGDLLVSLVFDVALHSVALDMTESTVFVGGSDGKIYQFSLEAPPRMQEYHLTREEKEVTFVGHTKTITCLSVSVDNVTLLSGSADAQVKVWNIPSRQCIRTIPHKGPITNAFFTIAPKHIFSNDLKPTISLHSFQRSQGEEDSDFIVDVIVNEKQTVGNEKFVIVNEKQTVGNEKFDVMDAPSLQPEVVDRIVHQEEIRKLRKVNKELYQFAVEKVLKSYGDFASTKQSKHVRSQNEDCSLDETSE